MKRIGIVSDTHGLVHPNIYKAFKGVDLIIHAGDIVNEEVLIELGAISKVVAVKGNLDTDLWAKKIEEEVNIDIEDKIINVSHKTEIPLKGYDVVVRGHTHRPEINSFGTTLFINPGSANKERSIPLEKPSVAILEITKKSLDAKLIFL